MMPKSRHGKPGFLGLISLFLVPTITILLAIVPAVASASSQSFNVLDNKSQPGMLMSLTANTGVVEPASNRNDTSLVGVIAPDDAAFDIQPGQVSVKTDGVASTLISTLGGDIRVGDRIGVSSLVGVGAKLKGNGWIVGIAQSSLDAKTKGAAPSTVIDSKGSKHQVYVTSLPLLIKVTYYSVSSKAANKSSSVPDPIQAAADTVAGKHASILALLLSFFLLAIGVMAAGLIVNAAIRGGFLAISRQPLTKVIILRKVALAFGVALVILILVFAGAFVILRIL